MDPGIIAAIIGAISAVVVVGLTAFFGLRTYPLQKKVDRDNYVAEKETDRKVELRNRRMKEYERYLTAFRGVTSLYDFGRQLDENSKDWIAAVNELRFAYSNLFQIASDRVLVAVTAFHTLAWLEQTDLTGEAYDQEWRRLYVNMITEMRTDAFETTRLNREWIEQNLPFDFPQVSEPARAEQEESPPRRAP